MLAASTRPLDSRVRQAIEPLLNEDPRHRDGLLADPSRAARLLENAREQCAAAWDCPPGVIIFTSSGTESCNLALKGPALALLSKGCTPGRIIVGATEHSSVLFPARTLRKLGFDVQEAPVDGEGLILLERLDDLLREPAVLVSIASMDGETGSCQPMAEIAAMVRRHGALLHVDACLAMDRLPLDEAKAGGDLVSISGHKLGAPRGTGALIARDGVRLLPLLEGGTAEGGRRGGTPFVAGIVGLGVAAGIVAREGVGRRERLLQVSGALEAGLSLLEGVALNGSRVSRAPGMVNLSARGVDGEALQTLLARRGILVSSGSSCFQETGKPSHVLTAMGLDPAMARGSLLFAPQFDVTDEEIERTVVAYGEAVATLTRIAGR